MEASADDEREVTVCGATFVDEEVSESERVSERRGA